MQVNGPARATLPVIELCRTQGQHQNEMGCQRHQVHHQEQHQLKRISWGGCKMLTLC